ncbi:GerAB/ArcD/ProY family transporter [Defluviitalea phaphyphila]|uniref:GerAB/ArcD/ProY family transporter n=1 Tax=Defluviitalea phaphyphila TaxID=1473580 RepID=UPI0007304CC5|nr:endospore germination permease [Defluviitalea phaphyphila]
MIKKYDGKIGAKELFSIIFFAIGIKFSDSTPNLLIDAGLNASWVIPIISGLIMIIPLLCLLSLLKLYKNKNLLEIISHLMGKYLGLIIILLLLFSSLKNTVIFTRDYTDILSTMFYLKTPMPFILFIIIISSAYISSKEINIIGSLGWFLFPIMEASTVLLIVMSFNKIDIHYIFPLGGPGIKTILKQSLYFSTILCELIFLAIFFPRIRFYEQYKKGILWGFISSIIHFSLFMLIYITVFGYATLLTLNYPLHQLTRLVQIGRFIKNVEALFLGFWAMASSIRLAIYFYITSSILAFLLKKNVKTIISFVSIIVFLIALVPSNYVSYILLTHKMQSYFYCISIIFFPVVLYIIAKLKGDYKN